MEQRTYMRTSLALLAALSLVVGLSWTPLTAHAGKPIPEHVQVLVVGGSPAGIAAAVAPAPGGLSPLFVGPAGESRGGIAPALPKHLCPHPRAPGQRVNAGALCRGSSRV